MKHIFNKFKILLLSLLVLVALVGSTYAYLIATHSDLINTFKMAGVDTHITEKTENPNQKEVQIENKDISSVYVRARVVVSGADVGVTNIEYVPNEPKTLDPNTIYVVYNGDTTEWVRSGTENDDWFYYKKILPGKTETGAASSTSNLITKVLVGADVPHTPFEVDVYQESVLTSDVITPENPFNLDTVKGKFDG